MSDGYTFQNTEQSYNEYYALLFHLSYFSQHQADRVRIGEIIKEEYDQFDYLRTYIKQKSFSHSIFLSYSYFKYV